MHEMVKLREYMTWKDSVQQSGSNLMIQATDCAAASKIDDFTKFCEAEYVNVFVSNNLKKESSDHATAGGTVDISYVQVILDTQSPFVINVEKLGLGGKIIKEIKIVTLKKHSNKNRAVQSMIFKNCQIKDMETEGGSINNYLFAFDIMTKTTSPIKGNGAAEGKNEYTFDTKANKVS